jgi:prolyl-tRNA synthetase
MRGREFIMKDAYSFHADELSLKETYGAMDQAYRRIFARCGLRAVAVEADSGAIGGSASQEFMVTADAGEDLVLASGDGTYAANQERAVSLASEALPLGPDPCQQLSTPGQTTIEALVAAHGFDPSQIVKVLLLAARFADGTVQPVLVSLRGDQQLNEVKLANALTAVLADHGALLEVAPLDGDFVDRWNVPKAFDAIPFGYLGPDLPDEHIDKGIAAGARPKPEVPSRLEHHFLRLADLTALDLPRFVCGANQADSHRVGATWADLGPLPQTVDLRAAQPGDRCLHDPSQHLEATRGIEVGHIFQLGRKYSTALEATFTNEAGQEEPLWMGCYGIGVSRLAQAAVEQNHDANGICWPLAIAPYAVIIVIANLNEPLQVKLAERLYGELQAAGVEVLLDDRDERAGVKFKDADLIGIPFRVVVGRGAASGQIELVSRVEGERQDLAAEDLLTNLMQRIAPESPVRTPAHL